MVKMMSYRFFAALNPLSSSTRAEKPVVTVARFWTKFAPRA